MNLLAALAAAASLLASHHLQHSRFTPNIPEARRVAQRVFGVRWRFAACITWAESRDELGATNGPNLGPYQINVEAHPWASPWRLTHSWLYSAKVAYRISQAGTDWSPWTTASLC